MKLCQISLFFGLIVFCSAEGPCEKDKEGSGGVGGFVPECTGAGWYKVEQYDGSTGYSFCVDPETGTKISATEVAPGGGKLTCPLCLHKKAMLLEVGMQTQMPQCNPENGKFKKMQTSGSTGYTWCVNENTGKKIPGTELAPGETKPPGYCESGTAPS